MTALNSSTRRRLQKLQQTPSIWEGDRRFFSPAIPSRERDADTEGDCILWVDTSQGIVRAMDVVPHEMGPEAVVRTLLRAMEQPHGPARPGRPHKIVVRDREMQFYLRGVLQDLNISVDYSAELLLIDEIFEGFHEVVNARPPELPPQYAELLLQKAELIWQDAPWQQLEDNQILAVEVNQWDLETLYISVMGMLGMEYGILMYRSLDSLKQFRQKAAIRESFEEMEDAFLKQDCLFLTYEMLDPSLAGEDVNLAKLPYSNIQAAFGNLHPLEGLRSFLHEEEAIVIITVLEALHRFLQQHHQSLDAPEFPALKSRYRIPLPQPSGIRRASKTNSETAQLLQIRVSTLPELATELLEFGASESESLTSMAVLRDDLVPDNSLSLLSVMDWDTVRSLRSSRGFAYQAVGTEFPTTGEGLPIVVIQTSQPKAKTLIQELQAAGGLQAICFNPGEDPLDESAYDLGLLKTKNEELHLFAEFPQENPYYRSSRQKWDQRCKKTKGFCGLVIARGITGASRGKPQLKDMMALFEAQTLSAEELGLGRLQLRMVLDWI